MSEWKDERTAAWRKAWIDLINVCHADTLNGMYCMLNGGGNLLDAMLGGGPYHDENGTLVEEAEGEPVHRMSILERAQLMTDLAKATEEGMTIARVTELEAAFSECLSRDEDHASNFSDDDFTNAVHRHVMAEFEDGEGGEADEEDEVSDFLELSSDDEVAELVSDVKARLEAGGLNCMVDANMVRASATIGDLSRAIADANQPPD